MTRRRKLSFLALLILLIAAITGGVYLYQWWTRPPTLTGILHITKARSRQLVALAATEAAAIEDIDIRLTRLLNLADLQIQRDWSSDARSTLDDAAKTLASSDGQKLTSHARISGWVSIADLRRSTADSSGAISACDHAASAMNALEDPSLRCEYVMGIANQLQYLKGASAAAAILDLAGPWTRSIDDITRRRQAVVSFASALFSLDDFPAGQRMLRHEPNATWRSQTLQQLASLDQFSKQHEARGGRADASEPSAATPAFYGRQLNYEQVFKNNLRSNTESESLRVNSPQR